MRKIMRIVSCHLKIPINIVYFGNINQLPKLRVVGSIPIYRSNTFSLTCTEKPRITELSGLFSLRVYLIH